MFVTPQWTYPICILALLTIQVDALKFTRCGLTGELITNGFQKTFLSNWVCLIEEESDRETSKVIHLPDGSTKYGIFQISNKKWCKDGEKGGLCNMKCEDLINENLFDDCECATSVQNQRGFNEWPKWITHCKKKPLPQIHDCPEYMESLRNPGS